MANEQTIELKFKVSDDGSVTLDKIGKNIQGIEQHTEKMNRSLSLIKWDAIINLGERAFQAGKQIYQMAREVAASGDEIERQAKVVNMSTTEYQRWSYVAYRADVDAKQFATGLKILSRNMLEADEGSKQSARTFEMLGVEIKDQEGKLKSYDTMLGEMAERFQRMEDGPKKVALAMEVFGRSGEALIPLLNRGKEGIDALREEFEKLGIAIDPETIRKLAKADEEFEKLEARWKTLKTKALTPLVVELSKLFDLINRMGAGESITSALSKTFGDREVWLRARETLGKLTEKEEEELTALRAKAPARIVEWVTQYEPEKMKGGLEQGKEAAEALAKALAKAAEQEAKLNSFFADDVELLKQAERSVERRNKAMDIMAGLGVKTEMGARREIEAIEERFKILLGQGFKPEELEKARIELEKQLRAVEEKYKTFSGWKETGIEGEVRAMTKIPVDELTRSVSEMVQKSIDELERMARASEEATGPKTIMIDYNPVKDANEAVNVLRQELENLSSRDWPITVTIDQRIKGDQLQIIEEELVKRIVNKQSSLGSVIQR